MNLRDVPSAIVEVSTPQGVVGSYLLSEYLNRPQSITVDGRNFDLSLRLRRFYKEFSLSLIDFRHDKYPGTETPKNFSSQVRLQNPRTGEDRRRLTRAAGPPPAAGPPRAGVSRACCQAARAGVSRRAAG